MSTCNTNGDVLVKALLAVSQSSTLMYIDHNFDPMQFAMPLRHCSASVRSRGETAGWSGFKLSWRCHTCCDANWMGFKLSDDSDGSILGSHQGEDEMWMVHGQISDFGRYAPGLSKKSFYMFLSHCACSAKNATIWRAWQTNIKGVFEWKPGQLRDLLVLMT